MTNIARIVIGASTVGGVATGGIFLNRYLSNEDIQSKLKANSFEILNNDAKEWDGILASYKAVSEKDPKFKFEGENIQDKTNLQRRCQEIMKKRTNEDTDKTNYYEKAKKWCTKPTSVAEVLGKDRTVLDTNSDKDELNKEDWDKKVKDYTATTNKDKITNLNLGDKVINTVSTENRTAIKAKCKELNGKQSYEEGYEEAIKKSTSWCSIEKKAS